jgi:hypothetical protein
MTTGLALTVANNLLNAAFRTVSYTAPAGIFLKFHIGDPGVAGASNPAALTTRSAVTFSAASAGALALSATVNATGTATETLTHFSLWDAITAGNFVDSGVWTTPRLVNSGDTITINTVGIAFTPLAA